MAYFRAWLSFLLFFFVFKLNKGTHLTPPTLQPLDPTYYQGVSIRFNCFAANPFTFTYSFWLNDEFQGDQFSFQFSLIMTSAVNGTNLTCDYVSLPNFERSGRSDPIFIIVTELPPPTLGPRIIDQPMMYNVSFSLICKVCPAADKFATEYFFQSSVTNSSSLNASDTKIQRFYPTYEPVNVSCFYNAGLYNSTNSNTFTVVVSAIINATLEASADTAYYGQEVNFTCLVELDPDAPVPSGGFTYRYRWYNIANDTMTETEDMTLGVTADSDLTYVCAAATISDVFIESSRVNLTVLELPAPSVISPPTPFYFPQIVYTFVCNSSLQWIDTFSWMVNSSQTPTVVSNQLSITLQNSSDSLIIECYARSGQFISPLSSSVLVTPTELPPPTVEEADVTQEIKVGQPFELLCNTTSQLLPFITNFSFVGVSEDGSSDTATSPNSSYMATIRQFQPYNYTCSYTIDQVVSPVSNNWYLLLGTIITRVTTSPSVDQAFFGQLVTFTCQVDTYPDAISPPDGDEYVVKWFDGEEDLVVTTQELNYEMEVLSTISYFRCDVAVNNDIFVTGTATSVRAMSLPPPVLELVTTTGHFVNVPISFICRSGVPNEDLITSYDWLIDSISTNATTIEQFDFIISSPGDYVFECQTFIRTFASPLSSRIGVDVTVPPPPSIVILDLPSSHYLVGTQHSLECQSPHADYVTDYCLEIIGNEPTCQASKRFIFVPQETPQHLSCYMRFGSQFTFSSPAVFVHGSGIVDTTASADTLEPYPGTNVTLTCSVTLTSGYDEANVTFSWKEGSTLIAGTKEISEYVTIDMQRSFRCQSTTGLVFVNSTTVTVTAKDLPRPHIEVPNRPEDDNYEPGYFYLLNCHSDLESLLTSYNWYQDGQLLADVHTKRYLAQAKSYTHGYTCTYVVTTEESHASPLLTIATDSILSVGVESNGLTATTLTPVFDSTLTLRCEADIKPTATEGPTYNWLGPEVDAGQVDGQELTIVAYAGYDSTVQCEVTVGDDVMTSNLVNITSREDIPSPAISMSTHQVDQVLPLASYALRCISGSLSLNTTVTWYKDMSQVTCLHDLTLQITRYDPSIHDGQYVCEISAFGKTAKSRPTSMLGIVPGKQCQESAQCAGQGQGYTGRCQDQRCVCSDGYKARLDICVLA